MKDIAKQRLETLKQDIDNMNMYPQRKEFLHNGIDNIINFMYNSDDTHLIKDFREYMQKFDLKRGEKLFKCIPRTKGSICLILNKINTFV